MIRTDLGMDVAYISEIIGDTAVLRAFDAPGLSNPLELGSIQSLHDVFCRHILEGRLPQMIPDLTAEPLAMSLPISRELSIGRHMSVPLQLADGRLYGVLCCYGTGADPTLQQRDLDRLKGFADLAANEISRDLAAADLTEQKRARIRTAIDQNEVSMVFQPVWDLTRPSPIGMECLARFGVTPFRSPDKWFQEAADVGLGTALEVAAVKLAVTALRLFPAHIWLAVNASPSVIMSGALSDVLDGIDATRIVLEITEHTHVDDYPRLQRKLRSLRAGGVRLAIDDTGAGYASLRHILHLEPELIKLDIALTRGIDGDPARRALATALLGFAKETNCQVIAEGVETAAELATLRLLGVQTAQGYLLGAPMISSEALALCKRHLAPVVRVA